MDNSSVPEWDAYIRFAETHPDLDKVREYVEEAEVAMFYRAMDLVHSTSGHEGSEALHRAADRLVVKRDRLKWPEPYFEADAQASQSEGQVS
jgi:hypothetical protein